MTVSSMMQRRAMAGPFYVALRLHGPQQAAMTGAWKQPPLEATAIA